MTDASQYHDQFVAFVHHFKSDFLDENDLKTHQKDFLAYFTVKSLEWAHSCNFQWKTKLCSPHRKAAEVYPESSAHRHSIKSTNWLARKLWNHDYRFNKLIATLREPSQTHMYLVVTFTKCLLLRRWKQLRMHGGFPPWSATLFWTERSQAPSEQRHFVSAILFLRAWGRRDSG